MFCVVSVLFCFNSIRINNEIFSKLVLALRYSIPFVCFLGVFSDRCGGIVFHAYLDISFDFSFSS